MFNNNIFICTFGVKLLESLHKTHTRNRKIRGIGDEVVASIQFLNGVLFCT